MSFLSLPIKKTTETLLTDPLKHYISTQFQSADKNPFGDSNHDEGIAEFHKLRNKACVMPLDKHESSLEVLYRYYDQLVSVAEKLPLTPTQIPINFKWRDAFDKGSFFGGKSSLSLAYGSYERACVLFNVAALQTQIAAAQPLATEEELKCAAKLYQQAAGVLTELKDHVLSWVPQEPTLDMAPDTLQSIIALLLAQAQDAIYLKAARDKMKPALLVKVSAQTADLYAEASKLMSRDYVKSLWDKEWLPIISGKQLAFNALAQYHRAQENNANKEIGEELARLAEATSQMSKARAYFGASTFAVEQTAMQRAYEVAKKDNDFIYHERVPELKNLPQLGKASLAKPIAPAHPMSQRFKDLFDGLVPVQVSQAIAAYDVRKTEIVNAEVARLREHTQLLNAVLTSLNLPAALDDATGGELLPESVRDKSSRVKRAGGVTELQRRMGEVPVLCKRNKEILDETARILADEKSSDDQLRSQFGDRWKRMPSDQLTAPLQQEIGKYRGLLSTAMNADGTVRQKFEQHHSSIDILSKSEPELKAAIPGRVDAGNDASAHVIQEMRQLMNEVEALRKERDSLEAQVKAVSFDMKSDFLRALSESGALDEASLSTEKLNQLYGPLRQTTSESVAKQEKLILKIQTTHERFAGTATSSDAGRSRETMLKQLAGGHDAFNELLANVQEGEKFYNDFTPLLVRLQQKVSDFCFARKTEKEDLMKELQQNIISGGDAKPTPPARPPPPQLLQQTNVQNQSSAPPPPNYQQQPQYGQPPPQQMPYPIPGQTHYPTQGGAAPPYQQQQQPYPYPQQQYAPYPPQGYPGQQPQAYGTYPGAQPMPPQPQQPYPGYPAQGGPAPGAPSPWHQPPPPQ